MKWRLYSCVFALLLATTSAQATVIDGNIGFLLAIPRILFEADLDLARVNNLERAETVEPLRRGAEFVISKFDQDIVKEFAIAWQRSGNGMTDYESVVLILQMTDGSYSARLQPQTNEHRSFTFRWHPGAVAIVHTHPNNAGAKPQEADCRIADKYGVPVFTITITGMFVYDPYTKKVTQVQEGLNWLQASSWRR